MPSKVYELAEETASFIRQRVGSDFAPPVVGIICGSGLSGLAADIQNPVTIPYESIPNFAVSTVAGHASKLVYGTLSPAAVPVLAMVGRSHFYEGHTIQTTTFPVRVMARLGVKVLIATNAAGGLDPTYSVGDLVVLSDHINLPGLVGQNPLVGPNEDDFGTRFPPMSDAYDLHLRRAFFDAAREVIGHDAAMSKAGAVSKAGVGAASTSGEAAGNDKKRGRKVHEGTYVMVSGPTYETRAECRLLRSLGADVVGMSTVPEIVAARHSGLRVLAISLVTNNAVLAPTPSALDPRSGRGGAVASGDGAVASEGDEDVMSKGKADHQEVLEAGQEAAKDLQQIVGRLVAGLASTA